MRVIKASTGSPEQMLDAFRQRIDELSDIGIDSSFDYPDDLVDLEDGEYESHATEPVEASYDDDHFPVEDVLKFLANKGYDTSSSEVKSYAEGVADYMDMSKAAYHETGAQWPYSLSKWYEDTRLNYPEELEGLPMIEY